MAVRDSKGRLLPGHPDLVSQSGVKPGRKKTIAGQVKDALNLAEDAMPEIIKGMIERSTDKKLAARDRQDASEYLIDRIYGKANLPITTIGKHELIIRWDGNHPGQKELPAGQPDSE